MDQDVSVNYMRNRVPGLQGYVYERVHRDD